MSEGSLTKCGICSLSFTSNIQANQHYAGKPHRKKVFHVMGVGSLQVEWSSKEQELMKKEVLWGQVVVLQEKVGELQAENIRLAKKAAFDREETKKALKTVKNLTSDGQEMCSSSIEEEDPEEVQDTKPGQMTVEAEEEKGTHAALVSELQETRDRLCQMESDHKVKLDDVRSQLQDSLFENRKLEADLDNLVTKVLQVEKKEKENKEKLRREKAKKQNTKAVKAAASSAEHKEDLEDEGEEQPKKAKLDSNVYVSTCHGGAATGSPINSDDDEEIIKVKKKQAQSARKLGRVMKGKMKEQADEILEMPQDKVLKKEKLRREEDITMNTEKGGPTLTAPIVFNTTASIPGPKVYKKKKVSEVKPKLAKAHMKEPFDPLDLNVAPPPAPYKSKQTKVAQTPSTSTQDTQDIKSMEEDDGEYSLSLLARVPRVGSRDRKKKRSFDEIYGSY